MSRYRRHGGWRHESYRHQLAARGVKTTVGRARHIPITAEPLRYGMVYPVSPKEVERRVGQMPVSKTKHVKSIEFVNPKGEMQKNAWGQYVRSRKSVLLFAQKMTGPGEVDGRPAVQVNRHVREYVIPHEFGHADALEGAKITDSDLRMAEARADANVYGMDSRDKDVKLLKEAMD